MLGRSILGTACALTITVAGMGMPLAQSAPPAAIEQWASATRRICRRVLAS